MRPIVIADDEVTDSAIRRLLFEASDDIEDLMILCEADITSKNAEKKQRFLDNFQLVRQKLKDIEEKDHIRNMKFAFTGDDIMTLFNLKPSPVIGELKNAIKEAVIEHGMSNDYDTLRTYIIEVAAAKGVRPTTSD